MTQAIQQRVAASLGAFREVLTNPNLRRVQLGFVGSIVGYWALSVALAVYAYRRSCRWRCPFRVVASVSVAEPDPRLGRAAAVSGGARRAPLAGAKQ
jgi:hypothetical protein